MDRRNEEENLIPIKISADISPVTGVKGIFEFEWVKYPYAKFEGQEVDAVPAGKNFEIHLEYRMRNTLGGLGPWSTCMTVWDVTGNKKVGDKITGTHSGNAMFNTDDIVSTVMPAVPTTYRVKLFASGEGYKTQPTDNLWK